MTIIIMRNTIEISPEEAGPPRSHGVGDDDIQEPGADGLDGASNPDKGGSPAAQLAQLGRALGHPLRVEILNALLTRDEVSPRELAALLDEPLGTVSYHVRYLVTLDVLELERMVPRRGAVQHFYSLKGELRQLLPAAAAVLAERSHTEGAEPRPELGS